MTSNSISGFAIASININSKLRTGHYIQINDNNDWSYGNGIRRAHIFDTEQEARNFIEDENLFVSEIEVVEVKMDYTYSINGGNQ